MSFESTIKNWANLKEHNSNWGSRRKTWGWGRGKENNNPPPSVWHPTVKQSCLNTASSQLCSLQIKITWFCMLLLQGAVLCFLAQFSSYWKAELEEEIGVFFGYFLCVCVCVIFFCCLGFLCQGDRGVWRVWYIFYKVWSTLALSALSSNLSGHGKLLFWLHRYAIWS